MKVNAPRLIDIHRQQACLLTCYRKLAFSVLTVPFMLKRKNSDYDAPDSSIFGDVPTRTKRLFRRKDSCRQRWTPQQQNIMPELLEYILQHEEAFKKYTAPPVPISMNVANMCKPAPTCIALCGLPTATGNQSGWIPCQHRGLDEGAE